jgi:serine/threonine protein kinase
MVDHPNYELLEQIASSEQATVWRGRVLTTGKEVAIKILSDSLRADENRLKAVYEGAAFLARLRDREHFVDILDLDRERGWIIMEYMGHNLAQDAAAPLSPDRVRQILYDVLAGLSVLEKQKRLHAGIKPSNLFVTDSARGRIKLGDSAGIDLADEQSGLRQPDLPAKYFAPEMIDPSFGPIGPPADLYVLGFTALELLAGPAFDSMFPGVGPTAADPDIAWLRVHGTVEGLPTAAHEFLARQPEVLQRVLGRLLSKRVEDRYQSADEVVQDLKTLSPGWATSSVIFTNTTRGKPFLAPSPLPIPTPTPEPSRDWNAFFSKPYVLYPTIAGIGLLTLLALIFTGNSSPPDRVPLRIESNPPGATISLLQPEGAKQLEQKTNHDFSRFPVGKHRLRFELDGHDPQEIEIEVLADGSTPPVVVQLQKKETIALRQPKTEEKPKPTPPVVPKPEPPPPPPPEKPTPTEFVLRVESVPPGASVLVGMRPVGRTPVSVKLPMGLYSLNLTRAGYEPSRRTIQLDEDTRVEIPLAPLRELSNSLKMRFRRIEPGEFRAGPSGTRMRVDRAFYLGVHEVTQEQYERVMKDNPSTFTRANAGGANHPVEGVSFEMARDFCEALSNLAGRKDGPAKVSTAHRDGVGTGLPGRQADRVRHRRSSEQGSGQLP